MVEPHGYRSIARSLASMPGDENYREGGIQRQVTQGALLKQH
jgi:hypothetical protein